MGLPIFFVFCGWDGGELGGGGMGRGSVGVGL